MLQDPAIEVQFLINLLQKSFKGNEVSIMSSSNRQVLVKASKGPTKVKLSEIFRQLIEMKVDVIIKDFSLYEASLH